ncbi:rare lipoprotein A precursor [Filimonas lacunae]|nr:rare lipoprotein A precursor [Filimonas lacunae]
MILTSCHRQSVPEKSEYSKSKPAKTKTTTPAKSSGKLVKEKGKASYYGNEFDGRKTASGEIFRQSKLTAAHRTLPFGTMVTVKNLANGKSVTVRINDRGPYAKGRLIDLSKSAAQAIDMVRQGVGNVEISYKK